MTHLCVAIFVTDIAKAKREIALAGEAGADMVELRVDQFADEQQISDLIKHSPLPCILTCRPTWEGGHSDLPDDERLTLLSAAASAGAAYVDVELRTLRTVASGSIGRNVIASTHDFQGRPDRLHNLIVELNETPATVNKIVWTARTLRNNLEAFEIIADRQKPTIALCMGEAGLISRVLAKKFGAFLTFASLDGGAGTAPGQIPITDMKRLYRWDAIKADTKIYGVVGNPIVHSMSPAIHNAAFDHVGHNGVYLPLLVESGYESFKAFMESFLNFDGLDLAGLSITIPHKENALHYLQEKKAEIEPLAQRIGAVNTIVIGSDKKLRGFSTDYAAILDTITDTLGINRQDLAGYRIGVIGAGGTGRTAVAALAHCGATVVVYNRTRDRADALAAEFHGKTGKVVAASMEKLCDSCCQIYINATSVGMFPLVDQTPWGKTPLALDDKTLVFDTVYNPMQTKLLREAAAAGAKTVGGVEMFVRQAAGQFFAWTAKPAPLNIMRNVVENRLGR
jgi:3-dehydroquinate dehydratase / shikimate dehydrogenase